MNKQLIIYPTVAVILLIAVLTQMFYGNSSVIVAENEVPQHTKEKIVIEENEVESLEKLSLVFVELEPDRYINDYNAFSDKEEFYKTLEQEYLKQTTESIDYNEYYVEGSFQIDDNAKQYIVAMAQKYKIPFSLVQDYLDVIYSQSRIHSNGSEGLGYFRLNSVNLPVYKLLIEGFNVNNFKHNTQAFVLHCLKLEKEGKLELNQVVKEIGLGEY